MLVALTVPEDAENTEKTITCPGSSARERPTDEDTDRHSDSERPFDYFARPHSGDFDLFFRYHPQQNPTKAIPKVFYTKDGTHRKCLTYCEASHSLYCSVCLMFAKPSDNAFVKGGMQAWKHVHQRIEEHEKSKLHRESAEMYFLRANKADIRSLVSEKQMSVH